MNSRKIFLSLFLSLLSFSIYAQDFWQEVYTGSFDPPILKVSSGGNVYTISDSFLVSSADNGLSWNNRYQFTPPFGAAFGTSPTGVIYLSTDSLRKSRDEGIIWETVNYPYFGPFQWFVEANKEGDIFVETGVLIGSYSYRSEDEGETWIKIGIEQAFLYSITFDPEGLTYAVYQGNLPPGVKELYSSTNDGDTWIEITTAPDNLIFVYCTKNGDLFAAEWLNPGLYKSTDRGLTWTVVLNQKVNSMTENQEGELFIAVDQIGVFWSQDTAMPGHSLQQVSLYLQQQRLMLIHPGIFMLCRESIQAPKLKYSVQLSLLSE